MANKVRNTLWKVTFDKGGPNELVILALGEFLESEIAEIGGEQSVEVVEFIESDDAEPMPNGNVQRTWGCTVFRKHASHIEAREYVHELDLSIPIGVQAPLTVEITGGATYVYGIAVFRSWKTTPRQVGLHETATSYELAVAQPSLGTPSGPQVVGLAAATVNLPGTAGLLDAGGLVADSLEAVATWTNEGTGTDAVQATAGKRPLALQAKGLFLPGVAGNYASIPDAAGVDFAASFTLRIDALLPSYRPGAQVCLASKWITAGDQRSWRVLLNVAGTITLEWSTDGTAATVQTQTSTAALPLGAWEHMAVWVQKSGTNVRFYLSESFDTTAVVQLGDTITGVSAAAPFDATAALEVGACDGGTTLPMRGFMQRVRLWKNAASLVAADATLYLLFRDLPFTVANELIPLPFTGADVWAGLITISVFKAGLDPARLMDGGCLRGDGADDYLALATAAALNDVSGATLIFYGRINRVTGTQDLIYCGTNGVNPRCLLRLNATGIELHVRRTDAEAAAVISYAAGLVQHQRVMIAAVVDYVSGTATIYVDGSPKQSGALTSAGNTAATDSSETVILAGHAGANPAAADASYVYVAEEKRSFAEISQYYASIVALGGRA